MENSLLDDFGFWQKKAQDDFKIPSDIFSDTILLPGQRYLQYLNSPLPTFMDMMNAAKQATRQLNINDKYKYRINIK